MILISRAEMHRLATTLRAFADDLDRRLDEARFEYIAVDSDYPATEAMPTREQRRAILKALEIRAHT